ncbi:MAG: polyprenyl synthetase family protein [Rubricoccaceae bacterium]|nr:polyprenyl synthetase family protein [Rubricoccaceae bacterium]
MSQVRQSHIGLELVDRLVQEVEEELRGIRLPSAPTQLYEPIRYVLSGGGKRLRPVLVLLTAEAFGGTECRKSAIPAALAVELFHNFTLIHDDIMDHAETRRGRPTIHQKWDQSTAILCGDLMMGMAYEQLARVRRSQTTELLAIFSRMVRSLCEGQMLDMVFEKQPATSVDDYLDMIDAKTGALIEATLELGSVIGKATERQTHAMKRAGGEIGRAFQIQDDLLDLTAKNDKWGKTIGGDLMEGKKTFLLLSAIERADQDNQEFFSRILDQHGLPAEDIPEARRRMQELGVLDLAASTVLRHSQNAQQFLDVLPENDASHALRALVTKLVSRVR